MARPRNTAVLHSSGTRNLDLDPSGSAARPYDLDSLRMAIAGDQQHVALFTRRGFASVIAAAAASLRRAATNFFFFFCEMARPSVRTTSKVDQCLQRSCEISA